MCAQFICQLHVMYMPKIITCTNHDMHYYYMSFRKMFTWTQINFIIVLYCIIVLALLYELAASAFFDHRDYMVIE